MPKLNANGVSLHYQQVGRQQDVVMVHGLFSNLAFWYFSVLPRLAPECRITMYDLRGHGFSDMPPSGYTLDDMADDLAELVQKLGVGTAHVVGHSFGGAVALHYAVRHPEKVRSVTLADARVPVLQPFGSPPSRRRWPRIVAEFRRAGIEVPQQVPRIAYGFFEELLRVDRERRRALVSAAPSRSTAMAASWAGNARASRRWQQLVGTTTAVADLARPSSLTSEAIARLPRPVLAVFGQYSSCLPTLRGLQQLLPACRTVMVRGAGHFHPILRPELLSQALLQFIRSAPS